MVDHSPKDESTRIQSLFIKRLMALKKERILASNPFLISGLCENANWVFICSEHKSVRLKDEEAVRDHLRSVKHVRPILEGDQE